MVIYDAGIDCLRVDVGVIGDRNEIVISTGFDAEKIVGSMR